MSEFDDLTSEQKFQADRLAKVMMARIVRNEKFAAEMAEIGAEVSNHIPRDILNENRDALDFSIAQPAFRTIRELFRTNRILIIKREDVN